MITAAFRVPDILFKTSILLRKGLVKGLIHHGLHRFFNDPAAADDFVTAVKN